MDKRLSALTDLKKITDYAPTFGGLAAEFSEFEKAAIAVLPVPYDATSTYSKGADRGPAAILEASTQVELYDIESRSEVFKRGITTLAPLLVEAGPEILFEEVRDSFRAIIAAGKFPVMLGGEHSVSAGAVAALKDKYPRLSVLQLDAHGDTRESYQGSKYNHACVMARIREYCPIVQVGIRAIDSSEVDQLDPRRVFFAHEIHHSRSWQEEALTQLSEDVFVTIDLDCFDSSIMPSTGTPEPGGLNWTQVTTLLRKVAQTRRIVGFDVVELLPRPENPAPDFLAAKLVYQFLSYIFATWKGGKENRS